jgi:aryl-alcohol dehydrogenase-like predicted oxidoreductase
MLTGTIAADTVFEGDDLRKQDPKFQAPRLEQYLDAVRLLDRYARERYQKDVLALALRWVLDQPGVSVALWGARHPGELSPMKDVVGWHLDEEALLYIDEVIAHSVKDPIGPGFMAPPEHKPGAQLSAPEA